MINSLVPAGTSAWVVTDGKIGDEVQCFGLAEAMGLAAERRLIKPRAPWWWAMPYGPIDPREASHQPGSPVAPPFPDILIAAGRRTVPYLRHAKKASGKSIFTIFIKDPYTGLKTADLIWVPEHDRLRGDNVIVTLTPANRLSQSLFEAARARPDPRLGALAAPRLAMVLGGPSINFSFDASDAQYLADLAVKSLRAGYQLMITPSRRTPAAVMEKIQSALAAENPDARRAFVWDQSGDNPYVQILAHADAILVTGDSVNMVGEAVTTGKPVYVYEPSGKGHEKMTALIDQLIQAGAVRRYAGSFETFSYAPIESTQIIAAEAAKRFSVFRENLTREPVRG